MHELVSVCCVKSTVVAREYSLGSSTNISGVSTGNISGDSTGNISSGWESPVGGRATFVTLLQVNVFAPKPTKTCGKDPLADAGSQSNERAFRSVIAPYSRVHT
jgi:hypothetical protein